VQNPRLLGSLQTGDNLQDGIHRFAYFQRAGHLHPVAQRSSSRQLHRDHGRARDFLGAEDIDAVGMVDRGGDLPLAQEAFARLRRIQGLAQDLQRHAPAIVEILGLEHHPHAALAQQPRQAVMSELFARLGHAPKRGGLRRRHRLVRSGLRLGFHARFKKTFRAEAGRQARGQFRAASGAPG